jgi:hypothetical protein
MENSVLPGFFPVMNEVQAGGVSGGIADSRMPDVPWLIRLLRFGSLFSAIQGRIKSQVAESQPITNIFCFSITSLIATIPVFLIP